MPVMFVYLLLLLMCVLVVVDVSTASAVTAAVPQLMREILVAAAAAVVHENQCLICRLLDTELNAKTCPSLSCPALTVKKLPY